MDHMSVAVFPAATVTLVVFEAGLLIVALPLTILQLPVPDAGLLAAIVNELALQLVTGEPALAVVGAVIVTFAERGDVVLYLILVPHPLTAKTW
jgi:hypothetical protein